MNVKSISTVSNTSNIVTTPFDKEIQSLQKFKMQLKDEIGKIRESKMDPKMKQDQITKITEQINEIDVQIRQKQLQKMKSEKKDDTESSEEKHNDSDNSNNEKSSGVSSPNMISAISGYLDLKAVGKVRTEMKARLRSETHNIDPSVSKRLKKVEEDMQKKSEKISRDLKKASEDVEKDKKADDSNNKKAGTMEDTGN
ncbi:MAG TPA: FlxA-like family protein, partial [Clostridia bacterium]